LPRTRGSRKNLRNRGIKRTRAPALANCIKKKKKKKTTTKKKKKRKRHKKKTKKKKRMTRRERRSRSHRTRRLQWRKWKKSARVPSPRQENRQEESLSPHQSPIKRAPAIGFRKKGIIDILSQKRTGDRREAYIGDNAGPGGTEKSSSL